MRRCLIALAICLQVHVLPALAQTNRIDMISPFAPELAQFGRYPIGVRTIEAIDRDRIDVINTNMPWVSEFAARGWLTARR
mgnify:CR=1 FL=1